MDPMTLLWALLVLAGIVAVRVYVDRRVTAEVASQFKAIDRHGEADFRAVAAISEGVLFAWQKLRDLSDLSSIVVPTGVTSTRAPHTPRPPLRPDVASAQGGFEDAVAKLQSSYAAGRAYLSTELAAKVDSLMEAIRRANVAARSPKWTDEWGLPAIVQSQLAAMEELPSLLAKALERVKRGG